MDLLGLTVLCAVAAEGSINAGARSLGLSPTTAWRRLNRLEADLGCRLLERTAQHNRLTQAGREVVRRGRALLEDAESIKEVAQALERGTQGVLRVAMVPGGMIELVLPALDYIQARRPGLRLVMYEAASPPHPVRDDFDLVITHQVPEDDGLFIQQIHSMTLRLFASQSYVNAHGLPRSAAELDRHPLLIHHLPPESPFSLGLSSGEEQEVAPILATTNPEVVYQWVTSGRGLGLLPSPTRGEAELVPVLSEEVGRTRNLYLVAGLRTRDSTRLQLAGEILEWMAPLFESPTSSATHQGDMEPRPQAGPKP